MRWRWSAGAENGRYASREARAARAWGRREIPRVVAADMRPDPGASHIEGSPFRRLLLERTPRVIATPALIVANVLIYAATAGASGQTDPRPDVLVGWGALFGPGVANGEWWRLVSAMFLHAGILHIALNCLFLRQIGNMVERLLGSFAFLTIYLVTGVTGAMASLMAHPRSIGVGASGALFGITGTLLAVVLSSGGQMRELLDDRPISVGLGRPDAEITPRPSQALGEGMLTGDASASRGAVHIPPLQRGVCPLDTRHRHRCPCRWVRRWSRLRLACRA